MGLPRQEERPDIVCQQGVDGTAASPPRRGPSALSALGEIVIDLDEARRYEVPTGNPELVQACVYAEPAGGEARKQVQQGQWALGTRRTRPDGRQGAWESRSRGVNPADGSPGKGAPGPRGVRDDERAHGDPGEDGPIYIRGRKSKQPRRGGQGSIPWTERREPSGGIRMGAPKGS